MSPDGVRVAFQLDRFEQTGGDRLEVAGRWYGVRGLRFVRPALTVQTQDGERNLLALLEHKPWAVEEGQAWVAAFPWQGDSPDPDQAELTVAPSVVVALVSGDGQAPGPSKPNLRERLQESDARARHLDSEVAWLREEREALVADKRAAEEEAAELRGQLREAASASEATAAERDAALRERDDASFQRDAALKERDELVRSRQALEAEHDQALADRDTAAAGRDQALRELQQIVIERDQARGERDALAAERDEALDTSRRAMAERDAALGRGSGFPAVSASDLARQPHSPAPAPRPHLDPASWTARAIAAGALLVLLLVVIVLLRFL